MRLLIDQNLSWKLVRSWADIFPGSAHIRDFGLEDADDQVIWSHAAEHGFVLITKDSDFDDDNLYAGPPPKVVHVLAGNASTAKVDEIVRRHLAEIQTFEVSADRVFEVS